MAKTGRNDPCRCGSRIKYKRCCLAKDQAAAAAIRPPESAPTPSAKKVFQEMRQAFRDAAGEWDEHLDEESNHVIDLINDGKLDEAELAAQALLEKYPDMIDGLERLGAVHKAKGNSKLAADYYRKALAHVNSHEGFGPGMGERYQREITELEAATPHDQ
jgi:tetratricopeptide (TPR) repeat protein